MHHRTEPHPTAVPRESAVSLLFCLFSATWSHRAGSANLTSHHPAQNPLWTEMSHRSKKSYTASVGLGRILCPSSSGDTGTGQQGGTSTSPRGPGPLACISTNSIFFIIKTVKRAHTSRCLKEEHTVKLIYSIIYSPVRNYRPDTLSYFFFF